MDPHDEKIMESIPLSKTHMMDRDGWHFTNNEKYTGKSGYQVERVYLDKKKPPVVFGPTVDILKGFFWKVRYTKDAFLMAIGVRVYSSYEKSASKRTTRRYMLCQMWSFRRIDKPCFL